MPQRDQCRSWVPTPRLLCAGIISSFASALLVTSFSTPSIAQSKPSTTPAANPAPAQAAVKAYTAGVKAFDKGNTKSAVTSLSAALRQGGLPPQQMAKALFYRGSAYRVQKKPAQAISDLTSAIWIKGGLSDADRLAAIEQRKAAYKEAGLGTSVPKGLQPGQSVPSTAVAASVPVAPQTASPPNVPTVKSEGSGTATSAWTTTAAGTSPNATKQVANAASPPSSPASQPFSALSPPITPTPATSNTASASPKTNPAPSAPQTGSGIGTTVSNIGSSISEGFSGVGSFFGNMFSSTSAPPAPNAGTQIATSSTAPAPQLNVTPQSTTAPTPAVTQGWNSATKPSAQPVRSSVPRRVETAALARNSTPTPKPASQTTRTGKFRLQVAAVRSEAKAQQVVTQLTSKYSNELAGAQPTIDAAAIGNMGIFYRVRVGPYADTKAPRGLCARLKTDGFDCLIVTP